MESIYAKGRDNSRTPMQWDNTVNAGFTMGTPWIKVNPNYININVQAAISNPDSIYHYYRKLISLRKKHKVIVYGSYDLLLENHSEIFAYKRALDGETVIVICNFSRKRSKHPFWRTYPVLLVKGY